jgi:sulfide:quinone oxidoreductase
MAAARRLREQADDALEIMLIERDGRSQFLPGTIATALGEQPLAHWQQPIQLQGITVRAGEVTAVSGSGVTVNGEQISAAAVIAAPGLALDLQALPNFPTIYPLWSPETAAAATNAITQQQSGTVAVIISSLPYRCPPAPYGLAMQLQAYYREQDRPVQVILTTPEERPLAAIGQGIPDFLEQSAAEASIGLYRNFRPDWAASEPGQIASKEMQRLNYDLALVVPPHVRSPLLRHLPGDGPLVAIKAGFESDEPGLFVIGDAAQTLLPRAAGAAAAQGETAADAVLARLGLRDGFAPHLPAPDCFIGHGNGRFSRIAIRFPDGLPPAGKPQVILDAPLPKLAAEFEQAFVAWQRLRNEPSG